MTATISPVTASPARAIAPKAASEIGRALLSGTIAAQQEVFAPIEVDVVVSDGALVAEPVGATAPSGLDIGAIAARHQASFLRAAWDLAGADLSEDGVLLLSTLLQSHRAQNHEFPLWVRGQDGAPILPYDFSDAMDEAKSPPNIRALFKGFGLSLHSPASEMSEVEIRAWVQRTMFHDSDSGSNDFDHYLKECGSSLGIYRRFVRTFDREIGRERARVHVWPAIERRVWFVEMTNHQMMRGEIDQDTAMVRVAKLDFSLLDSLLTSTHPVYREIVDAMDWFEGFSRLDIAAWSGHDPAKVPLCKVKQGFPAWSFPERLHEAVLNGHMIFDPLEFEYKAPTIPELVEFASTDQELLIANLRVGGIDYADIEF